MREMHNRSLLRTGMFTDMSNADYHAHLHMGSSGFKLLRRSPLHFWAASPLNPNRERREPSRIMLMGTAWHTGIWEPHLFAETYAAKPDLHPLSTEAKLLTEALADLQAFTGKHVAIPEGLSKRTKEGRALLEELEATGKVGVEEPKLAVVLAHARTLQGKVLLSADDLEAVRTMSRVAAEHPVTRVIKDQPGVLFEASIFWVDKDTGAPCRIRPDLHLPPGNPLFPNGLIVDGKSNDDSSPTEFARSAWNSEMFYQAAFYSDGFQAHYGTRQPPVFAWMGQERDTPHATAYYSATDDLVEYGRRLYRPLLRKFAACLESNDWHGYPINVQALELPAYAAKAVQEAVGS